MLQTRLEDSVTAGVVIQCTSSLSESTELDIPRSPSQSCSHRNATLGVVLVSPTCIA